MEKILEYPKINFGNRYTVISDGTIISNFTNKPLKYAFKNDSYKRVVLTDENSKQHLLYVHRIIAYNFLPNPQNLPLINHKDENPSNNSIDNIEWCSHTYNNTYNNVHLIRGAMLKGKTPWNKGKHLSEETKQKISRTVKKKHSLNK